MQVSPRRGLRIALFLPALALAQTPRAVLTLPASKLKIGHDQLAPLHWQRQLLETPSDEGQFEMLLDKSAAPQILATTCRQPYLVLRMPGVLYSSPSFAKAVAARKKQFADLLASSKLNSTVTLTVTATGYGHLTPQGKLQLTGCNLWLTPPR